MQAICRVPPTQPAVPTCNGISISSTFNPSQSLRHWMDELQQPLSRPTSRCDHYHHGGCIHPRFTPDMDFSLSLHWWGEYPLSRLPYKKLPWPVHRIPHLAPVLCNLPYHTRITWRPEPTLSLPFFSILQYIPLISTDTDPIYSAASNHTHPIASFSHWRFANGCHRALPPLLLTRLGLYGRTCNRASNQIPLATNLTQFTSLRPGWLWLRQTAMVLPSMLSLGSSWL